MLPIKILGMEHLLASRGEEIQLFEGAGHQLRQCVIDTQLIVPQVFAFQILRQTTSNKSVYVDMQHFHFSTGEQSAHISAIQLMPPANFL